MRLSFTKAVPRSAETTVSTADRNYYLETDYFLICVASLILQRHHAAAAAAANMGLLIDLRFRQARLVSLAKRLVYVL